MHHGNGPTHVKSAVECTGARVQWISVALENSVEEVSCPDNINSVYCLLSGHETLTTEFSNATEIHCSMFHFRYLII